MHVLLVTCCNVFSVLYTTEWNLHQLADTYLAISDTFIKRHLENEVWKVTTIKSYLNSFGHYMDFVNLGDSLLKDMKAENIKKIQRQVQLWNGFLHKKIVRQNEELQIKDHGIYITLFILM